MADSPYRPPLAELTDLPPDGAVVDLSDYTPASSWERLGAYLIDLVLVIVGSVLFGMVLGVLVESFVPHRWLRSLVRLAAIVPTALAFGVIEASGWRGSPGKKVLGLVVLRADGGTMELSRSLKRNFIKYVAINLCFVLAFSVLGGEGRSLWDNSAATRVLKRNPYAR